MRGARREAIFVIDVARGDRRIAVAVGDDRVALVGMEIDAVRDAGALILHQRLAHSVGIDIAPLETVPDQPPPLSRPDVLVSSFQAATRQIAVKRIGEARNMKPNPMFAPRPVPQWETAS